MNPPRQLSHRLDSPVYHPSYMRVGVKLDGVDRTDVMEYNADAGWILTTAKVRHDGVVEPYWRYEETRQQRRAREAWERKHA